MKRMGILVLLILLLLFAAAPAEEAGALPPVFTECGLLAPGSRGPAVLLMKQRLQQLGYYKPESTLDEKYTSDTEKRVRTFQETGGLPVTGTADSETLTAMFSGNAATGGYYTAPVPPSETSLQIGEYAEWKNGKKNTLQFRLTVRNACTEAAAEGYEIRLYAEDLWGERAGEPVTLTVKRRLPPGKTDTTEFAVFSKASDIFRVQAAVTRVRYADDTVIVIPEENLEWWNWKIQEE